MQVARDKHYFYHWAILIGEATLLPLRGEEMFDAF